MSDQATTPAESNPVLEAIANVAPANAGTPDGANGILAAMAAFNAPATGEPPATPVAEPVTSAAPVEPEPVTTDPDLTDLPPDATTPEAKETWKTLKVTKKELTEQLAAERKALEAERKLRSELEEKVKTVPAVDPEIEAKLKRVEELERKVAMVDIEATSAYQTAVLEPATRIETTIDQIVKSYDGGDEQVTAILNAFTETNLKTRREKLSELTADMDATDVATIKMQAVAFQEILAKRDQLKADAVNALKEAKASETRKREQMTQMERAAYKTAVTEAKARLATGLKDKFGDSIVAALDSAAESVSGDKFEFSDPNVKAFAALSAAALPTLVAAHTNLQAKVAELEATLAAYEKASPKPGGVPAPAPVTPEPLNVNHGPVDVLTRMRLAAGA